MRRRIRGERRFREFNMSTFNFIFADQVFIDPTFSGIFVCGPLQSFAVNVCARTIACEQALLGNLGERSEPHEGARACRSRVCFSRYPLDWISPKSQNGELDCRLLVPFRAEKRSAQASAHLLSQAQGGLFCVLTVFVCCWSSE